MSKSCVVQNQQCEYPKCSQRYVLHFHHCTNRGILVNNSHMKKTLFILSAIESQQKRRARSCAVSLRIVSGRGTIHDGSELGRRWNYNTHLHTTTSYYCNRPQAHSLHRCAHPYMLQVQTHVWHQLPHQLNQSIRQSNSLLPCRLQLVHAHFYMAIHAHFYMAIHAHFYYGTVKCKGTGRIWLGVTLGIRCTYMH